MPRAIPDWFDTVTTSQPDALSWWIACAAPGRSRTLPGSCRNPSSSTIVPSRARNTARWVGRASAIERGPHRGGDGRELVEGDGARIEHHAVGGDAGDDRRGVLPQPGGPGGGRQLPRSHADEPRPQLHARERTPPHLPYAPHHVPTAAHTPSPRPRAASPRAPCDADAGHRDGEASHLEERRDSAAGRGWVAGGGAAVVTPDPAERGAGAPLDARHPDRPADLDQLAARHDRLATAREG